MAVNLRWALALACAAGVRGKHSTPPVYSSTSLGRRLAASPPVDGAVAHLRERMRSKNATDGCLALLESHAGATYPNPNSNPHTLTLTLTLTSILTLALTL